MRSKSKDSLRLIETAKDILTAIKPASVRAVPTNDVILAEINRQREATERVMSEAFRLARSYDELQKVIKEMDAVATNHVTTVTGQMPSSPALWM